jgi:hypothetical protein
VNALGEQSDGYTGAVLVLDTAEREGLDPPLGPSRVEALDLQVVHAVVDEGRRRVADGALGLAVEQCRAAQLGGRRLRRDEIAERGQLGSRRAGDYCMTTDRKTDRKVLAGQLSQ